MEEPAGNKLPFLDALVLLLPTGVLETSDYRKCINAGTVLLLDNSSPPSHIRNCVKVFQEEQYYRNTQAGESLPSWT